MINCEIDLLQIDERHTSMQFCACDAKDSFYLVYEADFKAHLFFGPLPLEDLTPQRGKFLHSYGQTAVFLKLQQDFFDEEARHTVHGDVVDGTVVDIKTDSRLCIPEKLPHYAAKLNGV
uniref:CPSF_A domain-containing protein n=1 Tax=Steinernema glaseri TaxID=37863 RepID=A0A1I7ZVQ3_9BILA